MHRALVVAGLVGRLTWLVGNGGEARSRAIERWADDPPDAVFAPGRPPFFYALTGPPTVVATVAALVTGPARPAATVSAASTVSALVTTAVLVRTVVLPLRAGSTDRGPALRRWYRLNRLRMALLVVAVSADARVLVAP